MAKTVECSFERCSFVRVQHDGAKVKNVFRVLDHVDTTKPLYCSIECFLESKAA